MLFLYKNELNTYQVIDDINSKETILAETKDLDTAILAFEHEVKNRRKTTIMSFSGKEIKDYR